MKERQSRLKSIKNIIRSQRIESQDVLLDLLNEQGFEVTQATLSRDLKMLKVGKVPDSQGGYVYALPGDDENHENNSIYVQDFLRGYLSIDFSGNIVVIKTFSGHANTVCNAIDNLNMKEVLGTVAGDNCMFACLKEGVTGHDFMNALKKFIPEIEF
jgi:transcriptional regulator of arginine metabolism